MFLALDYTSATVTYLPSFFREKKSVPRHCYMRHKKDTRAATKINFIINCRNLIGCCIANDSGNGASDYDSIGVKLISKLCKIRNLLESVIHGHHLERKALPYVYSAKADIDHPAIDITIVAAKPRYYRKYLVDKKFMLHATCQSRANYRLH